MKPTTKPTMRSGEAGSNGKGRQTIPDLVAIVEAILFASDRPVSLTGLAGAIPEADTEALASALSELSERYAAERSGVGLQEMADGYQLTTRPTLAAYVERFLVGRRRVRLSRAALETLATVAYRQPVTRGQIEDLRGVDCGQVLHTLLTRELITVGGRSDGLGRPLLYGTTPEFLTYFGLRSLTDLPNLEEFQSLTEGDPLEDPEIREALEANGLLEGLDDSEEGGSEVADEESDTVGSSESETRIPELEPGIAGADGTKEDDFATENSTHPTTAAARTAGAPEAPFSGGSAAGAGHGGEDAPARPEEPARDDEDLALEEAHASRLLNAKGNGIH